MSYSAEDLLPLFYAQLSHGCNGVICNTKECRTCRDFIFKDKPIKDLDVFCTDLAFNYEANPSSLCKNLSPILLRPKISTILIQFFDFARNFIHDQPVDKTIKVLPAVFGDVDVFCHIFLTNDGFLRPENLNVNVAMCKEFNEAISRHLDLILPYKDAFFQLIDKLAKYPNIETLHWIRGVLIMTIFSPMFKSITGSENLIDDLLAKMTTLSSPAFQILYNFIITNPDFIGYLNTSVHFFVDEYIESSSPDPHTPKLHTAAALIEIFSEANTVCDTPIDQSNFVISTLNNRILPEFEYKLYKNDFFSYLKTPSILDVSFKNLILRQYSRSLRQETITIRRDNIVEDAINKVLTLPESKLQKHLKIQFENETAQDSGGVSREFYFLLFNEFFSNKYNLFSEAETGGFYWFTNKNSRATKDDKYYQYVGTIVGLAVSNSIILPVRFPMVLYKKLYDVPLTMNDYEELYPEQSKSLKALKEQFKALKSDAEVQSLGMELFFSITDPVSHEEIPIVQNGLEKPVLKRNINEYIKARIDYQLNTSVQKEFDDFKKGFKLSHPKILQSFKYYDLDVLISGTQVLNWDALKTNTTYANGYANNSPAVVMFWKIFNQLEDKKKELLLQFITGCARAPAGGLEALNIVIQKSGDTSKLPTSHTCFNTLVLPEYTDEGKMRQSLEICAGNAEGFGLI